MYEDDAGSTFVVCFRDGLEPFLAGGVPDLHLDAGAVDIHRFDLEVDPDRRYVSHLVLLVYEAKKNVGFANCRIADYDDLYEVVVFVLLTPGFHAGAGLRF